MKHILLLLIVGLARTVLSQTILECPMAWLEYNGNCYDFVYRPLRTFQEATIECQKNFASLVSVQSSSEHSFIVKRLARIGIESLPFFTSGVQANNGDLVWQSDYSVIQTDFFLSQKKKQELHKAYTNNIVYSIAYQWSKSNSSWFWVGVKRRQPSGYICEIPKSETWKFYQQNRDFSFGTGKVDPNTWRYGPNITVLSGNLVFVRMMVNKKDTLGINSNVVLECEASGKPAPKYTWYREAYSGSTRQVVSSDLSKSGGPTYTVTNGRLHIDSPEQDIDVGTYYCEAENEFGKVESSPVQVSYGYMDEFSNVKPGEVEGKLYNGIEIQCTVPAHKPSSSVTWFKENVRHFIRTEQNPQYFLSKNGNLYISEIGYAAVGRYKCTVTLSARPGETLTTSQPPAVTSLFNVLTLKGETPNRYGPDIHDKFPQTFPPEPRVGSPMIIECLAFGRLPLIYNWVREDGPMNRKAKLTDHGRKLVIDEPRIQDSGNYTCVVKGIENSHNKSIFVSVVAKPYFPYPLQNQLVDQDSRLEWTCNAISVPVPIYTWYKDGKKLTSKSMAGVTVMKNKLIFNKVEGKTHNGMYQCEAKNKQGATRTSAELRAMTFAPTFSLTPVKSSVAAGNGGSIVIKCDPQGAPRPDITWEFKNGPLPASASVLPTGALFITDVTKSEAGNYTCVATNSLGTARSSTVLSVLEGVVLTKTPVDIQIAENDTGVLECEASFDARKMDAMFVWYFNDHKIDFEKDDFAWDLVKQGGHSGTLYIRDAQYKHQGRYTCIITSVTESKNGSADVIVNGPPEEPIGVHVHSRVSTSSVELWWQEPGKVSSSIYKHGYEVTHYLIEVESEFDPGNWTVSVMDLPKTETFSDEYTDWAIYTVEKGLSPGAAFRFRVTAGNNEVGYGPASEPSAYFTMHDAAPVVAPSHLSGGGGSEQQLHFTWEKLPRSFWGSKTVNYRLFYRERSTRVKDGRWTMVEDLTGNEYFITLAREKYYTPYEVKIQAYNNEPGTGPNSTVVVVYSAERMPNAQVIVVQANAINSTAGTVEWQPIDTSRTSLRGSLLAVQVNYWKEDTKCIGHFEKTALFIRFYGPATQGDLIGMDPGDDYCFNMQVLNHAGLGAKSDNYYLGMNDPAPGTKSPGRYPEYVIVTSHGESTVRVTFRGVTTVFGEDPLRGYKAWWWNIREDIRVAHVTDFGKQFTGVLHGVEKHIIYKLRIVPYSYGGYGKKSQEVFFTLAGGTIELDPIPTEIVNSTPKTASVSLLIFSCFYFTSWITPHLS